MTIEKTGPTPSGGVRSEVMFFDADNAPCEQESATHAEAIEYDAEGREIARTYLTK